MGLAVWASSPDVPGIICEDARLRDQAKFRPFRRPIATADQSYGQTGWDIGVRFSNLSDLAGKLETLPLPSYVSGGGKKYKLARSRASRFMPMGFPVNSSSTEKMIQIS